MSYKDGEALILTQIQSVSGFNTSNTSRGDWGVLNKGRDNNYIILKPGEFEREGETFTQKISRYRTIVEVWQRYKDDGDSMISLEGHIENIINKIDEYRKLADTAGIVQDANIVGGGDIEEQWRNNADGPSWLKIDLFLDWREEDDITYAE